MTANDQTMMKRLGLALLIKLVVLFSLWWGFVRDQWVTVDAQGMAVQVQVPGSVSIEGDSK